MHRNDRSATAKSDEAFIAKLASAVLGWRVAPGRFLKEGKSWIPQWRFDPLHRYEHAFLLLATAATSYSIQGYAKGLRVEVRIGGKVGIVEGDQSARTITIAVARAAGIEPALKIVGKADSKSREQR